MNKKIRIYLAGTIFKNPPGCNWKQKLISLLPSDTYELFDPDPQNEPEPYMVARDKAEIQKCDIFVAYIEKPTYGTVMEIMYTYLLGTKPIIIINPNTSVKGDLWLEYHTHLIVLDEEDCANHIQTMRF